MNKPIGIVGGDLRIARLAELYKNEWRTIVSGDFGQENLRSCFSDFQNCDVIISGIPLSRNDGEIYAPFSDETIYIDELFKQIKGKTFIAGVVKPKVYELAEKNDINIIDIYNNEKLTILNTIPTAEGAIRAAIEESEITIHNSKILILGFGRIGKTLSKILYGMEAKVFCVARKEEDLAWIETYGYNKVKLEELDENIGKYDYIFNTIPAIILNKKRLYKIKKECVIIDLASLPGGVDFETAKKIGVKALLLPGLPGKVAPLTSAKYIKEVLDEII